MDPKDVEAWAAIFDASDNTEVPINPTQEDLAVIEQRVKEYNEWAQRYQAAVGRERAKIVKRPPSEMRLIAMVKKLHRCVNSDDEYETMYMDELMTSVQKLDQESLKTFTELFNKLGGRVTLEYQDGESI